MSICHPLPQRRIPGGLPASARLRLSIVLLVLALLLAACGEEKQQTAAGAAAPRTVSVVTLHSQSVVLDAELPGRTTAALMAEVRPQVDGIILKRLFREGGEVKAGDVLYQIDPATYQAAYDSAEAELAQAEAALPSVRSKAERYEELIKRGAISRQDYDDALSALKVDQAAVASAKANVETARINLGYTKVRAPIGGRIDKSSFTPGALVTANQESALTTIRQLDPINVDVTQSSTNFLDLRQALAAGKLKGVGSKVQVRLKLENGTLYSRSGTLEFAEAKVDEDTGTYTLRAEFPNPDHLLLPGMYVRAVLDEGVMEHAYLLPQRAVSRNSRGEPTALFVNAEGKVEQRVLATDRNVGNSWLVHDGVRDGDRLIVEGSQSVRVGQTVSVQEAVVDEKTGEVLPGDGARRNASSTPEGPAASASAQG